MSHREGERDSHNLAIIAGRVRYEARLGLNGRWYGHRRAANGRITDDFSYASRRSMRRAILTRIARGNA